MKVAVMLRTLEEKQGIGVYARNLMASLLKIDIDNLYFFLYTNKDQIGNFGKYKNLTEITIPCKNKLLWDHFFVSRVVKRYGIDVIFNTKFSVPLFARCKTAMVLHGSEWYVYPEFYPKLDVMYNKMFLPLYCKKATAISSVSQLAADDMVKFARFDKRKVFVVHSAMGEEFKPIRDQKKLLSCKKKFNLPDEYILAVGKDYPGKNLASIIKSFKQIKENVSSQLSLVLVGYSNKNIYEHLRKVGALELYHYLHFANWVEQNDLPAIYSMANLFLFPSFYEGFGIPIVEAMACGCPVVTSNTGACQEVAGSAATFIDPKDVNSIVNGVISVLKDKSVREEMIAKGFEQAKQFSWKKAARETLKMLHWVSNSD